MFFQLAAAVPSSPLELVLTASAVTKAVLVVLALLSLASWAVMLSKWMIFRRVERSAAAFMKEFRAASRLDAAASLARRSQPSAHTRVLDRALQFLTETRTVSDGSGAPATLSASQVQALRLVLDAETNEERDALGTYVPFLAMVGSVSPLLGLLGTVLGVITAFLGVARGGSGNLAAVAPGCRRGAHRDGVRAGGRHPRLLRLQHLRGAAQSLRRPARGLRLRGDRAHGARGTDLACAAAAAGSGPR
jgi:biopolymer transport protein TolQ